MCTRNSYVDILTPGTSECNLIWRKALHRGNLVSIKSLGWAGVLINKGNLETDRLTEGTPCEDETKDWDDDYRTMSTTDCSVNHRKLGGEA